MTPTDLSAQKNIRAVWAAGAFFTGWLILMITNTAFSRVQFGFSGIAIIFLSASIMASGIYLVAQKEAGWRLTGSAIVLFSSPLLTISERTSVIGNESFFSSRPLHLRSILCFSDPDYMLHFKNTAILAIVCLGASLLFSYLYKKPGKGRIRICALAAAAVYFGFFFIAARIILLSRAQLRLYSTAFFARLPIMRRIVGLLPLIGTALVLYLVCAVMYDLCNSRNTEIVLRGIGLVWAWIALIGAAAVILMGIISVFSHPARLPRPSAAIFYSYQLLTGISGFIGYLLLISKKRMGIYVILLGIGLMLGTQLIQVLLQNPLISGVPHSHKLLLTRLLPTALGALNPLFAYLAVKAGDQRSS